MPKQLRIVPLGMAVFLLLMGTAFGTTILDTGAVPSPISATVGLTNYGDSRQDFLAVQFTTTEAHTITDIQAYMYREPALSTTDVVNAVIYTNFFNYGYDIPGTPLVSFQIHVGSTADWYRVSGLSYLLGDGIYWLALEPDVTFSGSVPTGFPNVVDRYAYYGYNEPGNFHFWSSYEGNVFNQMGVRIYADGTPVPLPPAALLLGSGLLGLAGWKRFRES